MKPKLKLFLVVFIILCLFGAVGPVYAVEPTEDDFLNAWPVTCADPPTTESGNILEPKQVDYYSIDLVAGQVLIIDVDAEKIGSKLDSLLEVFDANFELVAVSDQSTDTPPVEEATEDAHPDIPPISLDPYLDLKVPPDGDGTYLIAISAANPDDADFNTGSYTFYLTCSNAPPVEPVKVGDLLGVTESVPGSLLTINPGDASGTLRYPLEIGPIADIEFDPRVTMLFAAIDAIGEDPGSIVTINPNTGAHSELFKVDSGAVVALEIAGDKLYGVHVSVSEEFSLVMINQTTGALEPVVPSLSGPVWSLAYHSPTDTLYAVVSGNEGRNDLVRIDLASSEVQTVGTTGLGQVVALDFSHEDILYGADRAGNLFVIPDLDTGEAEIINPITANDAKTLVSGLTFVVGYTPPVEPIKTICSSTFANSTTYSSESANPKLTKFKIKNNPLQSAVGLFKFQGTVDEKITVTLELEDESAESGEDCPLEGLEGLWPSYKGKGRVFLGLRDKIDGYDLRVKKKGPLPLDISADLKADGWYYIMVIRPLPRLYRAEYCLTLESSIDGSKSLTTLEVAWPGDNSQEDTGTSSDEANVEEFQNDEPPVVAASELESTAPVNEPVTVAPEEAHTPELVGETLVAPEAAVDGDSNDTQPTEDAAVDGSGAVSSDESDAKALRDLEDEGLSVDGQDEVSASTDQTGGVALAEVPIAEIPVEPEPAADSGGGDTQTVDTAIVDDFSGAEVEKSPAETPVDPVVAGDSQEESKDINDAGITEEITGVDKDDDDTVESDATLAN